MARNDAVEVRRLRIQLVCQKILGSLHQNKDQGWIQLDRTIADLQAEIGLKPERVLEYASIGEKRGLFIIDVKENKINKVES